jgi:DNA (cytosine-5)-methyltransferase 1
MLHRREIVIDSFAGGGGASIGIESALGRPVDVAINHDPEAIAMHRANHPGTQHFVQNVWQVDPRDVAQRRPVGLAWFSPDCKHFSKAKGGKPVKRHIRDLAWVVIHYAKLIGPRVIMLENVEEFEEWGPLIDVNGKMLPCPDRKGKTFRRWVGELRKLGYKVEWRQLRACDYGAPTIRKRLFLVARCDGLPIRWPKPTHGAGLLPFRAAAECIDWSIPCPSIFERKRPLAAATLRRIAKGIQRYVIDAAEPFIVPVTHAGDDRTHGIGHPLRTITCAQRGEHALVAPYLVPRYGERAGQDPRTCEVGEPMPTAVPTSNGAALVAAFLAQHNGGMVGHPVTKPLSSITQRATQQQVVTAFIKRDFGTGVGAPVTAPLPTITCDGGGHASLVRAFLMKYHRDGGQWAACNAPMHTLDCKARMGLVIVHGQPYQIVDIGMRMLTPRELFRAQGFPDSYTIDPIHDGEPLTKTAQVRMCGNSVCPQVAEAVVRANFAMPAVRAVGAAAE